METLRFKEFSYYLEGMNIRFFSVVLIDTVLLIRILPSLVLLGYDPLFGRGPPCSMVPLL